MDIGKYVMQMSSKHVRVSTFNGIIEICIELFGYMTPSLSEQKLSLKFKPEEYAAFMEENPLLRFTVMAMVSSGQSFAKQAVVAIDRYVQQCVYIWC